MLSFFFYILSVRITGVYMTVLEEILFCVSSQTMTAVVTYFSAMQVGCLCVYEMTVRNLYMSMLQIAI